MNPSPAHGAPVLQASGISKSFGGVAVLKAVDLEVNPGEVHALIGENGAGKSTLMNILAGVFPPDAGSITLLGQTHHGFASAHAAQQSGIAMVFQERSLFPHLSVAENIFAGRQPHNNLGHIRTAQLRAATAKLLQQLRLDISPDTEVAELSPAQQQMVEIAKALSLQARLIIFDEPTAALTESETSRLFAVIRELKQQGTAIIYISHRLEEIFALADRVTALKDGCGQGTVPIRETSVDDLIRRMVGRDLAATTSRTAPAGAPELLVVRDLSDPPRPTHRTTQLRNINLNARAGEIVGLAGLAGAGRTELGLALFGARPRGTGQVLLKGRPFAPTSPTEAIAAGLGYLSEDRKDSGLFLEMSIARNIAAANLPKFGGWIYREHQEIQRAEAYRTQLRIASRSASQTVGQLSGGNQQKALFARWLLVNPTVLIADEPTRGVDVGAKAELHQLLRDFADQGAAVLLISSDLPEVLALSDRIYVMRAGQIAGELSRSVASEEAVMRLAALEVAA